MSYPKENPDLEAYDADPEERCVRCGAMLWQHEELHKDACAEFVPQQEEPAHDPAE